MEQAWDLSKNFFLFSSELKKGCTAMIDSTYVKAPRTACRMASDGQARKLGRNHGGITSKIYLLSDDEGKPMDFTITEGQRHDLKIARERINRNKIKSLIGDKAYGSKKFRAVLAERHIEACIPPKSNAKEEFEYDKEKYKSRHIIENMFARLKDWKGIALRTNRNAQSSNSFICGALFTLFFCILMGYPAPLIKRFCAIGIYVPE